MRSRDKIRPPFLSDSQTGGFTGFFRRRAHFQPVIEALAAIQRNLTTHQEHFSEQVPIEGVVTSRWKEKVFEQVNGETKINRRYYELCVLEKLERALKCKEVWVEGSYDFRNPSEDLPSDWSDEQRRTLHYQALGKPLDAQAFVRLLRTRMGAALTNFNRVLPELSCAYPGSIRLRRSSPSAR